MKNWIWSVTQANWPTVKAKSVWAINKKGAADMVKNGDRLSTHLISEKAFECMKNDDFYGFVAERKITILNEIKKIVKY